VLDDAVPSVEGGLDAHPVGEPITITVTKTPVASRSTLDIKRGV
jgi:hypothetical protein